MRGVGNLVGENRERCWEGEEVGVKKKEWICSPTLSMQFWEKAQLTR